LALISLCGGLAGLFCHLLNGAQYVSLALGIVTAFRAGDAVVNWITNGKDRGNTESNTTVVAQS
jgi:hypothetical protein